MIQDASIQKLFEAYEKAFRALDIEKNAEMFADTFISAGPRGAIAQSKAEFLQLAKQASEFYKSVGQEDAKLIWANETPISEQYSLVTVHWGAKFQKTGERWIEFDVSYLVQKTTPEPKILLFIAHQDEQQAMEELGLLSE